jgi:hypothetical protein
MHQQATKKKADNRSLKELSWQSVTHKDDLIVSK